MKNFKFLLVLTLAISLFSCGSDDDAAPVAPSPNADLLGTWSAVSLTGTITGNLMDSSDNSNIPFTGTLSGSNINISVTFTETPNNVTSQGTFTVNNEVMIAGQTITTSETGITFLDSATATWTRNGSSLTITDDGETENFALTINGSTMTLSGSEMNTEIDGTETTVTTQNSILTFTKQ